MPLAWMSRPITKRLICAPRNTSPKLPKITKIFIMHSIADPPMGYCDARHKTDMPKCDVVACLATSFWGINKTTARLRVIEFSRKGNLQSNAKNPFGRPQQKTPYNVRSKKHPSASRQK